MEFVHVVKRDDLFDEAPHGFVARRAARDQVDRYLERARARGFFCERRHAEEDPSFKQIIPYTLIVRGSEVLLLRRSKRGGDARLHDKLSIGVGGHINPPDAEAGDPIAACALREIHEEIAIDAVVAAQPLGVINDDSNAVGAVHFGVVHVARIEARALVRVRETELLTAEFIPRATLLRMAADPAVNLETWSRMIAQCIDEVL